MLELKHVVNRFDTRHLECRPLCRAPYIVEHSCVGKENVSPTIQTHCLFYWFEQKAAQSYSNQTLITFC